MIYVLPPSPWFSSSLWTSVPLPARPAADKVWEMKSAVVLTIILACVTLMCLTVFGTHARFVFGAESKNAENRQRRDERSQTAEGPASGAPARQNRTSQKFENSSAQYEERPDKQVHNRGPIVDLPLLPQAHAPWTSLWTNSLAICTTMKGENITDITEWLMYYKCVPRILSSAASREATS